MTSISPGYRIASTRNRHARRERMRTRLASNQTHSHTSGQATQPHLPLVARWCRWACYDHDAFRLGRLR